jgi:NAD(P)-dependent dehydrogenase (short-subunit alcohol dehydrogenase family)
MDFKGKTALVTGSSGGIGRAIAIALAKEGADIVLASRNVPKLKEVEKEIKSLGHQARAIRCDVSKDASVTAMKEKALEAFKNIDIIINNAGIGIRGSLEDVSLDDWRYIINTNLMGCIRVVHAFLPHLLERGSGYIVNVSSIQAMAYGAEMLNTPYITTKAGIIGFTDGLAATIRPKGIMVSCHIPGGVITDIAEHSLYVGSEERQKELREKDAIGTKLPMFLTAEQCAAGLLEGMKKEDYLILTPANLAQMLKQQGRDVDILNAFVKKAKERGEGVM